MDWYRHTSSAQRNDYSEVPGERVPLLEKSPISLKNVSWRERGERVVSSNMQRFGVRNAFAKEISKCSSFSFFLLSTNVFLFLF